MNEQEMEAQLATAVASATAASAAVDDDEGPDENIDAVISDVHDAMRLFRSVKILLDYLTDNNLIRTVSKRERNIMRAQSEKIRQYLVEAESYYGEAE